MNAETMEVHDAVAGRVERRPVRTLPERLRSRAWEDRHHRRYREEAADEIERLEAALQYALGGLALAYEAATKMHNDEVLLHCGHHEAQLAKALLRPPNFEADEAFARRIAGMT